MRRDGFALGAAPIETSAAAAYGHGVTSNRRSSSMITATRTPAPMITMLNLMSRPAPRVAPQQRGRRDDGERREASANVRPAILRAKRITKTTSNVDLMAGPMRTTSRLMPVVARMNCDRTEMAAGSPLPAGGDWAPIAKYRNSSRWKLHGVMSLVVTSSARTSVTAAAKHPNRKCRTAIVRHGGL